MYTKRIISLLTAFCCIMAASCSKDAGEEEPFKPIEGIDVNTICFYYNWYGLPAQDSRIYHWAHDILSNDSGPALGYITGTDNDIASNYFPASGIYSSKDQATIRRHMEEMASAGIGVVALTWWKTGDIGHQSIPTILDEAARVGMKVCFHVEPYENRSAASFKIDIMGLIDQFGSHPAFCRIDGRPMFFVYDSYLIDQDEWAEVLTSDGKNTIRGSEYDSYVIGLLLSKNDRYTIKTAGFDGMYTYFASTNFTEGSTPGNWNELQNWCSGQGLFFIPSVGPGYIDTRIRPWNAGNIRDREDGSYYERMFTSAIDCGAEYIAITSFNEWHEGTQIEPACPMSSDDGSFEYLDYQPQSSDFYLTETAKHVARFVSKRSSK